MTRAKTWKIVGTAAAVILIGVLGWLFLRRSAPPAEAPPPPSALVTVAPIQRGPVREIVEAYGTIAGSPSASRTLAAPRAVIVVQVLVAPGQPVAAGAPLIVLANTPATELAFRQVTDTAAFAGRDLARVQRLYDEHLATNDQLAAARKALADARAAVAEQNAAGAGAGRQTLTASTAGVVGAVPVAAGEHVAADAPLLTVIGAGGLVAQLGVEPTHAGSLAVGQPVAISSPFDPARSLASRLSVVGRQVDPASRLVTVVAPASGAALPLGAAVEGRVTIGVHDGLLVPSASLVHDEKGAHLFTVRGAKAHAVAVTPGDSQGDATEVSGALTAGELVVVQGAYQLEDGMAVRTGAR